MISFLKTRIKNSKAIRKIVYISSFLLLFFIISSIALGIYIQQNKSTVVAAIEEQLNENLKGNLKIKDVQFKYLKGFPYATLALKQVVLKDSLWKNHRNSFIDAKEIEVRLNVWELIQNTIKIRKIIINDATIHLFKAQNGYSNYYLYSPTFLDHTSEIKNPIRRIYFNNVRFLSTDLQKNKYFDINIYELDTKLKYDQNYITAAIDIKSMVNAMTFKSKNGSFLKNKTLKGDFNVILNIKQNKMVISSKKFKIDDDKFDINSTIHLGKFNSNFILDLKSVLLWKNLTELTANNIRKKLSNFDFKKPIDNHCVISGNWKNQGNPKVIVYSKITNNIFKTPEGQISDCSFESFYSNDYVKGKGHTDSNSIIILKKCKGDFEKINFDIPLVKIINLKNPIAVGKIKSQFEVNKLNQFIDKSLFNIKSGTATINFDFNVNIVDLKIHKPFFIGSVFIKNCNFEYVPKNLVFNNTNVELAFTKQSLLIKKLKYDDKKSFVLVEGKIDDFLNLYYKDDSKMKVNWKIYSPHLNLNHFIGVLTKNPTNRISKNKKDGLISKKLQSLIDKSEVEINLQSNKITYNTIKGDKMKATFLKNNNQLYIKNGSFNALNGSVTFDAVLTQKLDHFIFNSTTKLHNLDLKKSLNAIDGFGLKSISSKNFNGNLSANTTISGILKPNGQLLPNSITLKIDKGLLQSFGGNIDFEGELYPKNKLYTFNIKTHINHVNASEILGVFNDFGIKPFKNQYLNGKLTANASLTGQLLPNWHLYENSVHLTVNNGSLDCYNGIIYFEGDLYPLNNNYAFKTSANFEKLDLDMFLSSFNYFDIKSLKTQKINGQFSTLATLKGTVLSNGRFLKNSLEVDLKKGELQCFDGKIDFDGNLFPKNNNYNYQANAKIYKVNITQFLTAFDNFKITSFQPKNINGELNATASIQGYLQPDGNLKKNTITGDLNIDINNGSLVDFEPIKNAWKIIFPFRDFKNITFSSITGYLNIEGDKVNVSNFKVNSNVLNFDMEGVYSFNQGTRLLMTIPLRNPKKDEKINDEIKKLDKRDNGIVIRLIATDDENGKIKIKWNKKDLK